MSFSPKTCVYKWVKLSIPWGDVRHTLCVALFVNSMAFVNNMVEVPPGIQRRIQPFLCKNIVWTFIKSFVFPNFLQLMGSNDRPDQNQGWSPGVAFLKGFPRVGEHGAIGKRNLILEVNLEELIGELLTSPSGFP